jgi:hypothetical protein
LDIATEVNTLECAKKNLRAAVEGYVEEEVDESEGNSDKGEGTRCWIPAIFIERSGKLFHCI